MKTLIYGAGPIGRWLALRLAKTGADVTLLARNETYRSLAEDGIQIVDGLTGERHAARVDLVEQLGVDDRYDLIVVAMQKASRLAVCPTLATFIVGPGSQLPVSESNRSVVWEGPVDVMPPMTSTSPSGSSTVS